MSSYEDSARRGTSVAVRCDQTGGMLSKGDVAGAMPGCNEQLSLRAAHLSCLVEQQNESFHRLVEECIAILGGQRRFAAALNTKESTVRRWRMLGAHPSRKNVRTVAAFASGLCGKAIIKGRLDPAQPCDDDAGWAP